MRIVVDTNVFINGIFKKDSFCKAIFNLKTINKVSFVMNKEMQNELLVTFGNILMEALNRIDNSKEFNIFPLMATLSKCLWQVEEIDHIYNCDYCKDDKSDNKGSLETKLFNSESKTQSNLVCGQGFTANTGVTVTDYTYWTGN